MTEIAIRYGVGVGKAGFEWSGWADVQYKRKWPSWTPPSAMIRRQPELEKYRNGHATWCSESTWRSCIVYFSEWYRHLLSHSRVSGMVLNRTFSIFWLYSSY